MIWKQREDNRADGESASAGSRTDSGLEAAQRDAAKIREDAQDWARQYLEESRRRSDEAAAQRVQEISALTDSLMARARAVAKRSDELISALDDAERRLLGSGHGIPEPASREAERSSEMSEGPRLLATQMAVAGSTRDEIAARLLEEFGIEDPAATLDDIGI